MSESTKRERTQAETIKLEQSLRQNVIVENSEIENSFTREAGLVLRELGEQIGESDASLAKAQYMGSAAVHIYQMPNLGTWFFVSQISNTIGKTPEAAASAAFTTMQNKMMAHYGRSARRGL